MAEVRKTVEHREQPSSFHLPRHWPRPPSTRRVRQGTLQHAANMRSSRTRSGYCPGGPAARGGRDRLGPTRDAQSARRMKSAVSAPPLSWHLRPSSKSRPVAARNFVEGPRMGRQRLGALDRSAQPTGAGTAPRADRHLVSQSEKKSSRWYPNFLATSRIRA
jgi:hypothetical protein